MADTVTVDASDVRCVSAVLGMAAKAFGSAMVAIPAFGAALEACGRLEAAADQAQMPADPVSSPRQLAIVHNEILKAYMDEGFDRSEAFAVVHAWAMAGANASVLRGIHGGG